MNPEERKLLEEAVALGRENNEMLKKLRRSALVANIMRAAYWIFIIGATVGAFYLVQPYIDSLTGTYNDLMNTKDAVGSYFSF